MTRYLVANTGDTGVSDDLYDPGIREADTMGRQLRCDVGVRPSLQWVVWDRLVPVLVGGIGHSFHSPLALLRARHRCHSGIGVDVFQEVLKSYVVEGRKQGR